MADELHDRAHYAAKNVATWIDVIYTPEAEPRLKDLLRAAIVAIEALVEGGMPHGRAAVVVTGMVMEVGMRLGADFEEPLA